MKNKIILIVLMTVLVLCAFTGCTDVMSLQAEIATLESERDMYADQAKDLEKKNNQYKSEVDDYKDIEKEYESYKSAMAEYEGLALAEAEARRIEAEKAIQESKEAAEKASIAEKESKEAEEALGYETGITYDQLARTPNDFENKKIKFTGKVVQVLEGDKSIDARIAVNSDYDTILYCVWDKDITSSRILENDIVTVYGKSGGLYTYESTAGTKVTLPIAWIDKVEKGSNEGTTQPPSSNKTLLYEDSRVKIYFSKVTERGVEFLVENLTDLNITIQADSVSINGISTNDIMMSDDVAPKSTGKVVAKCEDFETDMTVQTVGGQLRIIDFSYSFKSYDAKFINIPIE